MKEKNKKMITPLIKFNLKERGRKYRGQDRNFDIKNLVKAINSDETQERVKLGDLTGFYGHYWRLKFGAEPKEGGVLDGQIVNLEPCFRTTKLKAYDDGTVEHVAEFFPTDSGYKAWEQLQAKTGGFSSVITKSSNYEFHGFDFVREPNFTHNRPYTLDDTGEVAVDVCEIFVLDEDKSNKELKARIEYLMDCIADLKLDNETLKRDNSLMLDSLNFSQEQSSLLVDEVATLHEKLKNKETKKAVFDDVALDIELKKANSFKSEKIEPFKQQDSVDSKEVGLLKRFFNV